ncbi:diguanylate cyclase [Magnetospirillum aberrantis]|uniref:Diguanylate cyclase n=1 Tax=Magnetospirillum aberrantis SpK TaxID=908842 RepID=A0A7C9QW54_9PROT|nr:diguanylate cyclase [Magnetospirillum aberrantis]NFV81601.1 diguanylate cyclase [Magnetospirillum aberrantis SpK]
MYGLVAGMTLFVLLVAGVHLVVRAEYERLERDQRIQAERYAAGLVVRLESEIKSDVFLVNGLLAHVNAMQGHLNESVIGGLRALYHHGRHIRNIGVAPGNRIAYVYPLSGNESVLGLYYPDLPSQWPAVKAAMERRETTMAGPLDLRQGGTGLISRTPVFLEDGNYWGMISLVLDVGDLFRTAGIAPEVDGFALALRGRDGLAEKGEVFLGDPALFRSDPVLLKISVPGGQWQLAIRPLHGWSVSSPLLRLIEGVGLMVAVILAVAVYGYHRGRTIIAAKERRLRSFLETTRDGVIVIDEKGIVREFNPAAESLFGYTRGEVVGGSVNRLMNADDAAHHDEYMTRPNKAPHLMAGGREVLGRRKDGSTFSVEVSVGLAEDQDGRIHVGIVRDITERKAFERRLMELATTDGLTGALNRRAFIETAENAFRLARRYQRPMAVLMIDADHFKSVNDTHGHHVGDLVLKQLSALCRDTLRTTDTFGRLGGEEFMALLPETDLDHARDVAERLTETIRRSRIEIGDGRSLTYTVSIGLAVALSGHPSLEALMHEADQNLYRAKSEGRDRVCG